MSRIFYIEAKIRASVCHFFTRLSITRCHVFRWRSLLPHRFHKSHSIYIMTYDIFRHGILLNPFVVLWHYWVTYSSMWREVCLAVTCFVVFVIVDTVMGAFGWLFSLYTYSGYGSFTRGSHFSTSACIFASGGWGVSVGWGLLWIGSIILNVRAHEKKTKDCVLRGGVCVDVLFVYILFIWFLQLYFFVFVLRTRVCITLFWPH